MEIISNYGDGDEGKWSLVDGNLEIGNLESLIIFLMVLWDIRELADFERIVHIWT